METTATLSRVAALGLTAVALVATVPIVFFALELASMVIADTASGHQDLGRLMLGIGTGVAPIATLAGFGLAVRRLYRTGHNWVISALSLLALTACGGVYFWLTRLGI